MSLPRYGTYKRTGVAWLEEIPSHWRLHQARRLFEQRRDASLSGDEQLSATQKYGVIPQRLFMEQEDQKVVLALGGLENFKRVQPDDFVISLRSFQGGIERSRYAGCVSPAYTVLRPHAELVAGFWEYLLKSSKYIAALQTMTDGIRDGKNISYGQFGALCVPLAPSDEQAAIAAFLDRETAKIDGLIAEQERLVSLLAEKRQATISHAVTRGLNPDLPMKDSGVAWLGEVPAHWNLKRVKDCGCEIVDCKNRTPELHPDGDFFVIRTSCVKNGSFNPAPGYFTDEANFLEWTAKGRPQAGDVLFTREAPTGEACLAPENLDFCLGQRMMYIRPPAEALASKFLLYSIYGGLIRERIDEKSKGSTVGHLRVGEVGELPLLLPPLEEQLELIQVLDAELDKLGTLSDKAQRIIRLLKERRSALIASAVTGQIDVRNAVTPLAEEVALAA